MHTVSFLFFISSSAQDALRVMSAVAMVQVHEHDFGVKHAGDVLSALLASERNAVHAVLLYKSYILWISLHDAVTHLVKIVTK